MKRSSGEALKNEEDGQGISKASTASATSSGIPLDQNLNRLYKTIPNSAKNERSKKLRLEKASVSCFLNV